MSVLATIFLTTREDGTGRTARCARDRPMEGSFALSVRVQVANDDDRASRVVRALLAHGTEEQIRPIVGGGITSAIARPTAIKANSEGH